MKFYIVADDGDLKTENGDWTVSFDEAQQLSFKEAREFCERENALMDRETSSEFIAMIPIPKDDEKEVKPKPEQLYYIWCFERSKYWGPNERGYASKTSEAGKYSLAVAEQICKKANIPGLNEAMIPCEIEDKEDEYYLWWMDGDVKMYWLKPGHGSTTDKSKAHRRSFKSAEASVASYATAPHPVSMGKADD